MALQPLPRLNAMMVGHSTRYNALAWSFTERLHVQRKAGPATRWCFGRGILADHWHINVLQPTIYHREAAGLWLAASPVQTQTSGCCWPALSLYVWQCACVGDGRTLLSQCMFVCVVLDCGVTPQAEPVLFAIQGGSVNENPIECIHIAAWLRVRPS